MGKLKFSYELLTKGCETLKHVIYMYRQIDSNELNDDKRIVYRDSVIKRFEYCYDLMWKFLKTVLKEKYAIILNSPRHVFQSCFENELIDKHEADIFFEMIDARNRTSHIYSEEMSEIIAGKILIYYEVLHRVLYRVGEQESLK